MTMLSNVAAVVVTFNRSDKLNKVLNALDLQTVKPDTIYVIDNASTDNTEEVVKAREQANIRYIRLPNNIGGAGGFHEGMKIAYEDGANYLWISDDDAYPEPDALAHLLHGIRDFEEQHRWRPSFACSRVEWIDGSICEMNIPAPVWDWPRFLKRESFYTLALSCSFVSVLIPRWAVREHGLPIADYFIWFDDAEYTRRIARSYPGIFVPDSRVIHDTPENKGVNFGLITDKNVWKFEYGARNEASYHRRERGLLGILSFANGVRQQMRHGKVSAPLKRRIYKSILKGWAFRPKIVKVDS
ncbi:glycosyltransferase family 2 protein [Paracoccus sp. (in: a-proteobacteria)]|uniref:glycosyltransferase family 2 protein n=1 Tax=Paracoccus sp. TaxID=267 RepID=UPI00289C972C|nr:glycosyltransferase family 2 protein [Paracoccus sp. (in: a-proteobacteria)]